jgi:hypothetical protein
MGLCDVGGLFQDETEGESGLSGLVEAGGDSD